jgi:hypothetical protein
MQLQQLCNISPPHNFTAVHLPQPAAVAPPRYSKGTTWRAVQLPNPFQHQQERNKHTCTITHALVCSACHVRQDAANLSSVIQTNTPPAHRAQCCAVAYAAAAGGAGPCTDQRKLPRRTTKLEQHKKQAPLSAVPNHTTRRDLRCAGQHPPAKHGALLKPAPKPGYVQPS